MSIPKAIETKFQAYVGGFGWLSEFDTTPDADNDDGIIGIPTICLDGEFTLEELENIVVKFKECKEWK